MPVTANDLDWIDLQLRSHVYYSDPYNRVTYRLISLLNELEPMKYRITEPTFWMGQDRKPGDILTGETGPYRPVRADNGKMDRVAQFEEIHVTPLPPLAPLNAKIENHMSMTGYQPGAIRAALDAAKKKAQADLTDAMGMLSEAQAEAAKVPAAMQQVAGTIKKEAQDALQEFAEFTNGGPA